MLWEREGALEALGGCLADVAGGTGRMVLVSGEAGVGKTALVRQFCRHRRVDAQVWWGSCDALLTPGPLSPLYDIAREAGGDLAALMAGGEVPQHERFQGLLTLLADPTRLHIVVIEDVHWADQATLDLLVYLGRRADRCHALIMVTHRDDELSTDHPLRTVLGRLAAASEVRRVGLAPLSEAATAAMAAGHRVDPAQVHEVTGGNPFFITELLEAPPGTVPGTVRDAVLARVARLSGPARSALEVVAVVPDRAPLALVAAVTGGPAPAAMDECERAGILQVSGREAAFRHELARQAVAQAIPAAHAPDLHAAVLAYLADRPDPEPASLAYHAVQAHDPEAVLRYAPQAAAQATRLGAHRQAFAHYTDALRHAGSPPAAERADLLESYADVCRLLGRHEEGAEALGEAVELRRRRGEVDRCASAMMRQAQFLYMTAPVNKTYDQVAAAMAMAEGQPPSQPIAAVYAHAAYLHMLAHERERALATGARAVALAEQFGDQALLSLALVALAGVQWATDPDRAESAMVRAVGAAHASGRAASVTNATGFLGASALEARRYRTADHWLARVVDWCVQHDLDAPRDFYLACQAGSHFEQGRWPQAMEVVDVLTAPDVDTYPPARSLARQVVGRLAVRRGDPDQAGPLAEAWEQALRSGEPRRQWPVAAARAEAAWHAGRAAQIPDLIRDAYHSAVDSGYLWAVGELGFWMWRAGELDLPPASAAEPYSLHMAGEVAAAAEAWDAIGCPYEAAQARADSDDPDLMRAGLESFYRLGARPAANRLVHRLRKRGITDLPRRPHRSTGANPAGLTDRELEVATLLAEKLSNADIAARLHISMRTAGHHVGAILVKLGVTTRHDAARAIEALGIGGAPPPAGPAPGAAVVSAAPGTAAGVTRGGAPAGRCS